MFQEVSFSHHSTKSIKVRLIKLSRRSTTGCLTGVHLDHPAGRLTVFSCQWLAACQAVLISMSMATITILAKITKMHSIRGPVSLQNITGSQPTITCSSRRKRESFAMASCKRQSISTPLSQSRIPSKTHVFRSSTQISIQKNS